MELEWVEKRLGVLVFNWHGTMKRYDIKQGEHGGRVQGGETVWCWRAEMEVSVCTSHPLHSPTRWLWKNGLLRQLRCFLHYSSETRH